MKSKALRLTSLGTCFDIDLIVPSSIMTDVLDALGEFSDEFSVKETNRTS